MEQEIIQDNQFPFEILLHLASMFIIILLFKSYHAFQKFLAVKVADVISVAGLYADRFCKVRFSGIRFSENTEIVASFNKVKRGKHLCLYQQADTPACQSPHSLTILQVSPITDNCCLGAVISTFGTPVASCHIVS